MPFTTDIEHAIKQRADQARKDGHILLHVSLCRYDWDAIGFRPAISLVPAFRAKESVLWARSRDGMRTIPYKLEIAR